MAKENKRETDQSRIVAGIVKTLGKNPIEVQLTRMMLPNAGQGLNWKIIPKTEKDGKVLEENYENIKKMNHWHCWKVKSNDGEEDGYLLECDMNYWTSILDKALPKDLWTDKLKDEGQAKRIKQLHILSKDLEALKKSKSKKKSPIVCIYNQNKTPRITIGDMSVKAYAVTLDELAISVLKVKGYFVAKGIGGRHDGQKFRPDTLIETGMEDFKRKFIETLRYTAGSNSIQIQISVE